MRLIDPNNWPFWLISLVMLGAAWKNDRSFAIRNVVTVPFILTGWALGLLHSLDWAVPGIAGSLAHSLWGSFLPLLLSWPFLSSNTVGAGTVKLQMGYGAWVGAYLGLYRGFFVILEATLGAILILVGLYLVAKLRRAAPDAQPLVTTGMVQFICGVTALIWAIMT